MSVWEIKKKKKKAKVTVQCRITSAAHKEYNLSNMVSVFRSKIE